MRLSSDQLDDAYHQYLNEVEDDDWAATLPDGPDERPPNAMTAESE